MTLRRAFTLLEIFTAVAGLVIVMGLMVSLARHVRSSSANELTRKILRDLSVAMDQYLQVSGGALPEVVPFLTGSVDEREILPQAVRNSGEILRILRRQNLSRQFLNGVPEWIFDQAIVRDAWGSPIVFLRSMHPRVGMAPSDKPFFVSAGPDRKFLTREDNLYSYEEAGNR